MINPKFLICSINSLKSFSSGINIISRFFDSSIFFIFAFILFIALILFSISKHSFISLIIPLSSFLISKKFLYLSKDDFILSGSFSISFKNSSLKYELSYALTTFNNNSSSLLFNAFLIFVNIFCIFNFNSSFFPFKFSYLSFISLNDSLNLDDISSNILIFSFIPFFFSSIISSIRYISQLACNPYPLPFKFTIHSEQHNLL